MAVPLAASVADPVRHNGPIAAHALSGAVAFALGTALALRRSRHPAQAMAYAVALTLMALFAVGAVALDWPTLTPGIQGAHRFRR